MRGSFTTALLTALLVAAVTGCAARPSPALAPATSRLVLAEAVPAGAPAKGGEPNVAPASPPPRSEHEDRSDTGSGRLVGWVVLAIGAEAATVALATSYMLLQDSSTRSSNCNAQKVCSPDGVDANNQIRSLVGWNAGAWAVAAVGVGVGAYLVISNPPGGTRTAVGVGPNGSGVSLGLRSSF